MEESRGSHRPRIPKLDDIFKNKEDGCMWTVFVQ